MAQQDVETPCSNPSRWFAYYKLARLDDPVSMATGAVGAPCLWAITMSAYRNNSPPTNLLITTFLWILATISRHSAHCVWNDVCDVKFDRLVERSKNRPLVSGAVSLSEAYLLFASLLASSLFLLQLIGDKALYLGVFGIFALDNPYPFMKRWTHWPQAWLGAALGWGGLVAWASTDQNIRSLVPIIMFFASFCWTLHFDTIYGSQDKRDDGKAGVKSTAILFGRHIREMCAFFSTAFVICLAYAGLANEQGPSFFVLSVLGAALHLAWQLYTLDFDDAAQCGRMFHANAQIGVLVWFGILGDYLWYTVSVQY